MSTAVSIGEFFAPANTDVIDGLMGQYENAKRRLIQVHQFVTGEDYSDAVGYFLQANPDHRQRYVRSVKDIFDIDVAVKYLDSVYWKQALDQTDVYECMPQARKDEWNNAVQERKTPPFDEETVRATLEDLLMSRKRFIAEKIDGVFRRLSGEHITNRPEGFGKRFIMGYCFSYGSASTSAAGYLQDLREVIAKLLGREPPEQWSTSWAMKYARDEMRGQWVEMDGWALKIRAYLKGTVHIEVHPDIAWRLNKLLHELNPTAIPSRFRKPPKRKKSIPAVFDRPVPAPALKIIREARVNRQRVSLCGVGDDKAALKEARTVLEALGGVGGVGGYEFDFDPKAVLHEVVASGVIPDKVSHQFYPTPDRVADYARAVADIDPHHSCLEPSAGFGALWTRMADDADAVEISPLHCKALREMRAGNVWCADFLAWNAPRKYDRIVMNPPYSQGRALAHLEKALTLLAPGGRLVAILPASYVGKSIPGAGRWGQTFHNAFTGTSISVAVYIAEAA